MRHDAMKRQTMTFREQMKQSMADLESIRTRGQSPAGNGRFTIRTMEVLEPSRYDARSIKRIRHDLKLSQALFAQFLGVSPALVRAWELGTRQASPLARRLLDQVRAHPAAFAGIIRGAPAVHPPSRKVA